AVAGITFFEFAGALVLLDLLLVGKEAMGLGGGSTASLGAFAGLGIGVGSVAAGQLSRGRIEIGLGPLGAMGVGIGRIILCVAAGSSAMTACTLVLTGLSGGLVVVPLYATLQKQAGDAERGHLISTNNFLNMAAVLLSSGALWLLRDVLEIGSTHILLIVGLTIVSA